MHNKIIKKLCSLVLICSLGLSACSKKDKDKEESVANSKADIYSKIVLISDKNDININDNIKDYEKEIKKYKEENKDIKFDIENIIIDSNTIGKENFNKIINDNKIKSVIFVDNKYDVKEIARSIKEKRRDILTISSGIEDKEEVLSKTFDLNFNVSYDNYFKNGVQTIKSYGIDRFIYLSSDSNNDGSIKKAIEENCKKIELPFEDIKIDTANDKVDMQANLVYKINYLLDKYSNNIAIYPSDSNMNEVLLSMVTNEKFFIAGFSNYNITKEAVDLYGIRNLSIHTNSYNILNAKISNFYKDNETNSKVYARPTSNEYCLVRYPSELSIAMSTKQKPLRVAYNREYLEEVANVRSNLSLAIDRVNDKYKNNYIIKFDNIVY
ncbi:DUF3798 domain-containing protein [Peptostreptococcus equinus]|uniref:DUF3798 domain-containing protein n=1 Tax=Peptostreptococcus equinus TaxID=3003601 RepID=A0ABY7JQF4_9FIRM|nr:DUF3798 domain-containing protein [Peptostreptococcus sp. CBA3647]WAW15581.1 DUF3798 domain-containing protein [Peptostreptococcus sp. CBA3647]